MNRILYNPLSGSGKGFDRVQMLRELLQGQEIDLCDIREVRDYAALFAGIAEGDRLIVAGGDGTLNKFINFTAGLTYPEALYYYPIGSGNDFYKDVGNGENGLIPLRPYVNALPTVTVNGKQYRFLNGIGYGIDGYCCEVGEALTKRSDKPVNYASIAIKGLLFHYRPTSATVTVDGETKCYERVWLAPVMNGRYYGGGMMIAPMQERLSPAHTVTSVVMHGSGKLKTLAVFPSIFRGTHIKHTEIFTLTAGREMTVRFDRAVSLQIDGELVRDVTEYTVCCAAPEEQGAADQKTEVLQ